MNRNSSSPPPKVLVLAGLAALALLAYLPVFTQPFLSDDFVNILKAEQYVPPAGWHALAADPIHFYRPVFLLPTYALLHLFGAWPPAFYALSVLLHIVVVWLVYSLGEWNVIGWRHALAAAAFFAVHEGHQEAVMWYSAAYELYQAVFLLLALIFWIRWLQEPRLLWGRLLAALGFFALALASKESAVVLPALLLVPPLLDRTMARRAIAGVVPFALVALAHAGSIFLANGGTPRLGDGSFSFHAPFLLTWTQSYFRLLWIWGLVALAVILIVRETRLLRLAAISGLWMGINLVPYCFLLYMTRVPSRHTYLASIGLAWLVGGALLAVAARRRWALAAMAGVLLVHNVAYLWLWKRPQYLERARSTEALLELARRSPGAIYVHRFPYLPVVAGEAVYLCTGRARESVIVLPSAQPSGRLDDYSYSLDGVHPQVTGNP